MAKKKAIIVSCKIVHWFLVAGIAFCCFSFGSAFLKARNWLDKMKLSCRLSSLVGFCKPFSLKVADISEMVFWGVISFR